MELLFIKEIINESYFNRTTDIKLKGLFNYYENKIQLIEYEIYNSSIDDYEIVIDDNSLTEEDEKNKNDYLDKLEEELIRIKKIMEFMVVNIELLKLEIPHFKLYDYSNVSKHIKSKIKLNNHHFDIKKFLIKNGITDDILNQIKELLDTTDEVKLNETKMMSSFIILKVIAIYNYYNKCLLYSKQLLLEYPNVIKNKDKYLCNINKEYFNMNNDEISIKHFDLIKNSKIGNFINIRKNKNKNFEILFK